MNTFLEESLKHLSPFVNLFPDKLLTSPINDENQQMDSDVYLSNLSMQVLNKFSPKQTSIEDKRQSILSLSKLAGGKTISVGKVVDFKIKGVKVRYYRPKSIPDYVDLPVMVYAHGAAGRPVVSRATITLHDFLQVEPI